MFVVAMRSFGYSGQHRSSHDPATVTRHAGMETARDNAGRARRVINAIRQGGHTGEIRPSEMSDHPLAYLQHFQAVGGPLSCSGGLVAWGLA